MLTTNCPSREVLAQYAGGRLDDDSAAALDVHLSQCETCLSALESETPADSLVAGLRRIPVSNRDSSAYHRIESRLKSGTHAVLTIPGYEILEPLGQGGMGTVYKAIHMRLGKTVAIKVIRGSRDPAAVARFEREMKAVGRLDHPNVVRATDAGESGGVPYLVMEYVPGTDLSKLVKRNGPLSPEIAKRYVAQLASALTAAHAAGIVHRDVKPSNAILAEDGTVKLLDLGLALLPNVEPEPISDRPTRGSERGLTQTGRALGTKDYMAPEQATNPQSADARADVYGLGATLWFLMTGKPPDPAALEGRSFFPSGLSKDVWKRFFAIEPADRFATVADAAESLHPRTESAVGRTTKRSLLLGSTIAALAMISFGIWTASRPKTVPVSGATNSPLPGKLPFTVDEALRLQSDWVSHAKVPASLTLENEMSFSFIPPGEVGLSSECRTSITTPYYLGTCEVSRGQYRQFVAETGHKTLPETDGLGGYHIDFDAIPGQKFLRGNQFTWQSPGHANLTDDHPVTQVAWADATAFCNWLSKKDGRTYRLPTEAEWIWAARCGYSTDSAKNSDAAPGQWAVDEWYRETVAKPWAPQPVGRKRPNPWGLHDMLGNVTEICYDYFDDLPAGAFTDYLKREDTHHGFHVIRGGTYYTVTVGFADSRGSLESYSASCGFRVLCEIPEQK